MVDISKLTNEIQRSAVTTGYKVSHVLKSDVVVDGSRSLTPIREVFFNMIKTEEDGSDFVCGITCSITLNHFQCDENYLPRTNYTLLSKFESKLLRNLHNK